MAGLFDWLGGTDAGGGLLSPVQGTPNWATALSLLGATLKDTGAGLRGQPQNSIEDLLQQAQQRQSYNQMVQGILGTQQTQPNTNPIPITPNPIASNPAQQDATMQMFNMGQDALNRRAAQPATFTGYSGGALPADQANIIGPLLSKLPPQAGMAAISQMVGPLLAQARASSMLQQVNGGGGSNGGSDTQAADPADQQARAFATAQFLQTGDPKPLQAYLDKKQEQAQAQKVRDLAQVNEEQNQVNAALPGYSLASALAQRKSANADETSKALAVLDPSVIAAKAREAAAMESARQGASLDKFGNPIMVEADDGKGGRTEVLAQQDKKSGLWTTADQKRAPLDNVSLPETIAGGGRIAGQVNRVINAAKDAVTGLQNISQLPATATGSIFGGQGQTTSIMQVGKRWLGNAVTPQEVQDANVSFVGLGKALATLDSGGLQSGAQLMTQMDKLQLMPGDTQFTKMRKLSEIRQLADNSIETLMNGPLLSKEQKAYAQSLRDDLSRAIPWKPNDVSALEQSKNPQATLRDFAGKAGLGGQQGAAAQSGWTVQRVP